MPTGWRPADTAERFPVHKIEDVYRFDKYATNASVKFAGWIWVQTVILLLFVSWLFGNIVSIGSPNMFVYGGFIFLSVYALTELMDGNFYSLFWEIARAAAGISIIVYTGDWFGASNTLAWIKYGLLAYLICSCIFTTWFVLRDLPKKPFAQQHMPLA